MDTWENMQRAEQERQYAAQPEQKMQLREDWGNNPYLEQNIRLIKSRAYFTRQSYGQLKINDIYDTAKVSDKEISSVMGIMHCKSRGISNNRRDFLQQLENVRNMEKDDTETPERHEKLYIELNKLIDLDKKALKEECSYNGTYTMHAQRAIELSTNLKKYIVQKNYAQNVLLKTNSYTLAKGSEEYDNVSNVEKSLRNLEQELNLRYFTNEPINRILPAELKAKKDKSIIELQDNKYERTSLDINPNDWENNLSERNKNHLKNRLFLLLRAIQTKYSQHNENFKAIFCSFENYCNLNTSGKNKNNEILRETEFLDLILKELNILKSKSVEIKEMSGLIADYIQLIQTETKGYLKKKDLNFNKTVMNVNILNRYKKKTSFDISKVEMKDYNKRLLFAHEPCLSDIRQGELGDCYLFAGLASIVSRSPQVIKECMVDNGDGTVSVRFYDKSKYNEKVQYQEFYVTVKKEIPEFNNKAIFSQGAFWVHIMEQAYAASGLHTDNLIVDYKNISGGLSHRFIENLLGEEHNGKIKLIDKDINNKELDKNNYINGTINSLKEIVMPADRFKKLEQSHEDLFNNRNCSEPPWVRDKLCAKQRT